MKKELWRQEDEETPEALFEGGPRETLTDTHENGNQTALGEIIGSATGEEEGETDVLPGGWQGTDDATSTAPSDLGGGSDLKHTDNAGEPDAEIGRGYAGGLGGGNAGGITDIKGTPAEESRDWEHEPIVLEG